MSDIKKNYHVRKFSRVINDVKEVFYTKDNHWTTDPKKRTIFKEQVDAWHIVYLHGGEVISE